MKISRRFTKGVESPYQGIKFESRRSEIRDSEGNIIFSEPSVTVPDFWSQNATDILAEKYFCRSSKLAGSASLDFQGESDARQVFHRLAGSWTHWGKSHGYFDTEQDAQNFYDEICFMLAHQMASPNSPQWFNTGIHFAYGIKGPAQGHFYVDAISKEVRPSTSSYERPQPSACFIQSIRDDLVGEGGIMDLWVKEARLFKFGAGSGTNFSNLRAIGEPLGTGGVSSGLMSFLKVGDCAAGVIQSGGTTRRAAKMVCVDIDHPEIESFIFWKVREEQKVAAMNVGATILQRTLSKAPSFQHLGISDAVTEKCRKAASLGKNASILSSINIDWQGEAYRTVSGQNSNNSVRIPNSFFEALEKKARWKLRYRLTKEIAGEIPAEKLWQDIAFAAWDSADPGLQFDSTIDEWHTCPNGGPIRASNPCSEYLFLDDTACNLASLNLLKFVDPNTGEFQIDDYRHSIRLWTIVLEISVLMAQFPGRSIAQKCFDYRTIGLGYSNLGALCLSLGIPYASSRARALVVFVTSLLTGEAYATSAELARELGPFAKFSENREAMLRVIRNHQRALEHCPEYEGLSQFPVDWNEEEIPTHWISAAKDSWKRAKEWGEKWGFRNAQVSAIAPTGTIGLVMDCDTMGIEPEYALVKYKTLAGGGRLKLVNQSVARALRHLDYSAEEIRQILDYCLKNETVEGAPHFRPDHLPIFDCAERSGSGTRVLSPMDHVKMVAAAQPFVSGGISKTVNLAENTTVEEVSQIYFQSWKMMLKSISIYRNKSKLSQPMTTVPGEFSICGPSSCD